MEELPVGRRVAYWRARRKMSQQLFADRIGKSKSWVDKVERGERRLDSISTLHHLATVLQVGVEALLDRTAHTARVKPTDPIDLDPVRMALARFAPAAGMAAAGSGPPLEELGRSVGHAWLTFQHARYDTLVGAVPKLLRGAQAAEAGQTGDAALRAAHLLGQVYQVISSVTRKLGAVDLARLAAERSIALAQRADDPLLAGTGTTRFANALLAAGDSRAAFEANVVMAHHLAPNGPTWSDPDRVSVYGSLLLQGAMAAAHMGDDASVGELLREAKVAADSLGDDDNRYRTSFGPTNVELHRVAAAVELGEARRAVTVHSGLPRRAFDRLLPERRAQHLLDVARGHLVLGDLTRAGEALLEADRHAPAEIRGRPVARDVMTGILRQTKGVPPALVTELADRMGALV
ncbi:helix-turn-helix domain-containing protein [Micromonospora sp. NPDC049523]|uniref:helix-turn-helix domain-containing protein n=1 Tax=Micromonospora sp. NPDC049523 TaxID=3155921 RepID=UPI003447211C